MDQNSGSGSEFNVLLVVEVVELRGNIPAGGNLAGLTESAIRLKLIENARWGPLHTRV